MKKICAIFTVFILFMSCLSIAIAGTVKVPIDLSTMSLDDLVLLKEQIIQELVLRDANTDIKGMENEKTNNNANEDEIKSGLDTMAEGESSLSDESFILDMTAGLVARWSAPDQDTSIMSDKMIIDYYSMLVNSELVYVSKYSEYTFIDEKLGNYAQSYINGLNSQLIGITEYKGKDEKLYEHYWVEEGYNVRGRYIYLINKEYGLPIPSEFSSLLSEMVSIGQLYNYIVPMVSAVSNECYGLEPVFDNSSSNKYLDVKPMNFHNTSPYDISKLVVKINFINDKDIIVDSGYLVSYQNISAGQATSTNKVGTSEYFSKISYSYSFTVETSTYLQDCEDTVFPAIQFSWDGNVKKDGELTSGQPVLEITNLTSGWEMNTSWSKTLYIPALKFDVLNSGSGDANSIIVKVVFTNQETKQIWDEETIYVVSSSDVPLKAGFSKKAFAYSSVGYKSIVTPPKLVADIYINDKLTLTIDIK